MNYDIEIKSKEADGDAYYYKHPSTTQGGESVYYGNILDRAYWYDDDGEQWLNTVTAQVGDATTGTDVFASPTLYGTYADADLNEIESKEYVLADAWYRAETTVFDSLNSYLGCTEENECYRGYLPIYTSASVPTKANIWMISSGGTDSFDFDRLATGNALWCSIQTSAQIEGLWETREKAMNFASAVMTWLNETGNMEATENVTWCRLTGLPESPSAELYGGDRDLKIFWRVQIQLEIVYKTEYVYT